MVSATTQPLVLRNPIGSTWHQADGSDTLEARHPATEAAVTSVPLSNAREIGATISSTAAALPSRRATLPRGTRSLPPQTAPIRDEPRKELARPITPNTDQPTDRGLASSIPQARTPRVSLARARWSSHAGRAATTAA
ncbi:hypothetical protein [Thermogemmatispora carboxidivorans]|uniref:hypothetical protein n=1 Tax=Thermogemmatispora carboxidivorans TaxID=1382306 RepID=UPI000699BA6B|nr:hypothetical protein [Thermogemmatispora carboxidivorans]